jgi:phenylacetate-CoA ligase
MRLHANHLAVLNRLLRPASTRAEIVEFQTAAFVRLVAHAYENVPYYRRLFDKAGVAPRHIRSLADLERIPLTSKDDLRAVPVEDTVARGVDPERLQSIRTSGATGRPFTIRHTRIEQRLAVLFPFRAFRHYGLRAGDRRAGVAYLHGSRTRTFHQRVINAFGVHRRLVLDCRQPHSEILAALRRFRPDVLGGYAGTLARLAEVATEEDRRAIRPRFVTSSSEVLTPLMRTRITEAFGGRVYDAYGCHELHMTAWECKKTGELHVCEEGVIVEVLKDGRPALPGEQGELVGTNLYSFAMPFIRYRSGDAVTRGRETCACGRVCSTLSGVVGRMLDYFPLPDGRWFHPYHIANVLIETARWVQNYEVVQERMDRIVLRVVPFHQPSQEELARFVNAVTPLLGPTVKFEVAFVPEIPMGPGGKFRLARSLVHDGYYADRNASPPGACAPSPGNP